MEIFLWLPKWGYIVYIVYGIQLYVREPIGFLTRNIREQ